MGISALQATAGAAPASATAKSDHKLKQAASEFESILVEQMLRSAREGAEAGTDDDTSSDADSTMVEMGEQHLAQAIANGGGLGIARMVLAGIHNAN